MPQIVHNLFFTIFNFILFITKLKRPRYEELKAQGRLTKDGVTVQVLPKKGPLGERELSKLPLSMLGTDDE